MRGEEPPTPTSGDRRHRCDRFDWGRMAFSVGGGIGCNLVGLALPACRAHAASERNHMSRPQEPRFQFFGSLRACRDGTDGTAMRKGAASARGSGSTTPAQRNLLSPRDRTQISTPPSFRRTAAPGSRRGGGGAFRRRDADPTAATAGGGELLN